MKNIIVILFLSAAFTFSYAQKDSSVTRVYFEFGKFNLSESATKELDKLIPENSRVEKIKITGQTDQVGSISYNDRLSVSRANEVYQYLIKKGVDSSLAHEIIGYGKRNLMEADAAAKSNNNQLNRVVMITSYFKNPMVTAPKDEQKPVQTPTKSFEQQLKDGSSSIVLSNLTFVGGRHTLLPSAIPALENILETLKKYPNLEVEIQGHICCTESGEDGIDQETNEKVLSLNRAKAVYEYLVANGISASRMTYKGFGARNRLVNPERSEADFSANRRVEFKIIKQ